VTSEPTDLLLRYPYLDADEMIALCEWFLHADSRSLEQVLARPESERALSSIRTTDPTLGPMFRRHLLDDREVDGPDNPVERGTRLVGR